MSEKAKTYDTGKEPLAQIPWAAIDELARVQAYGHAKYGDFNNYRKGMEVSRNVSCAIRHLRDFMNGADKDHESGRHPLGHALCRIAFILQNIADGVAIDDRYKPAPRADLHEQETFGPLDHHDAGLGSAALPTDAPTPKGCGCRDLV